jgi:hypothetical protein
MSSPFALAALAGLVSAALFSTMFTGSPVAIIAGYFAPLPLFAVGLARGFMAAGIGGVAGAAAIAVLAGFALAVPFVLAFAAPVTILVRQALLARTNPSGAVEWYPADKLLIALAGLSIAIFGGSLSVLAFSESGVLPALEELIRGILGTNPKLSEGVSAEAVTATAALLPGIAAASWMIMMTVNGALAQAILRRRALNVRPSAVLADLTIPRWMSGAAAVAVAVFLLGEGWLGLAAGVVAFVAALVCLFQGLAVIHALARPLSWRATALVGFYASLVFVAKFTVPAVLLLGFAEPWLRLRQRFAPGGGREE